MGERRKGPWRVLAKFLDEVVTETKLRSVGTAALIGAAIATP